MENKNILGLLTLIVIGLVGVGIVNAHSDSNENNNDYDGYGMMGNFDFMNDMHEDMEEILESGNYSELETLREKYNLPMAYWIQNQEDLDQIQDIHNENEGNYQGFGGGC